MMAENGRIRPGQTTAKGGTGTVAAVEITERGDIPARIGAHPRIRLAPTLWAGWPVLG